MEIVGSPAKRLGAVLERGGHQPKRHCAPTAETDGALTRGTAAAGARANGGTCSRTKDRAGHCRVTRAGSWLCGGGNTGGMAGRGPTGAPRPTAAPMLS